MSIPIWPPIPLPYHAPLGAFDVAMWLLGWIVARSLCFVGVHAFDYSHTQLPFYGSGHQQCVMCDVFKVKP